MNSTSKKSAFSVLIINDELSDIVKEVIAGLQDVGVDVTLGNKANQEALNESEAHVVLCMDGDTKSLNDCLAHGMVPVLAEDEAEKNGITGFNPVEEKGAGFLFEKNTKWHIFAAIMRAYETHRFPYDWKNVVKAAKKAAR